MRDLDLLEAEVLGGSEADPGTSWWKWALGLAAAGGLGYYLVRDLQPQHMFPRQVPNGPRPW